MRQRLKAETRLKNPEAAADLESQPWYVDPDGQWGGDDWLTIWFRWSYDGQCCTEAKYHVHIKDSAELLGMSCGPIQLHDDDGCVAFSFPLSASYAFGMLVGLDHVHEDAELVNSPDVPSDYYDLELEEVVR